MKREYDFGRGKRVEVVKMPLAKTVITIRIDSDALQWFRNQVHVAGAAAIKA